MSSTSSESVTELLASWRGGDEGALDALMPLVYEELRRLASNRMRSERAGHSLAPTDLVHEAYGRLVEAELEWRSSRRCPEGHLSPPSLHSRR